MDQINLIRSAKKGDEKSFLKLLELISKDGDRDKVKLMANKTMYQIFNSCCIDRDDLEQEIKLAIWESIRKYEQEKGEFEIYTWKIIKNRMIDMKQTFIEKWKRVNIDFDIYPPAYNESKYQDILVNNIVGNLRGMPWYLLNLMNLGYGKKAITKALNISKEKLQWEIQKLRKRFEPIVQGGYTCLR